MFAKSEIKRNLLGCFEIAIFMSNGVGRFNGTKAVALKSLVLPVVLVPLIVIATAFLSRGLATEVLIPLHVGRIIISMTVFWGIVYMLAKHFGRDQYFWRFVNVSCWVELIGALLTLPILFGILAGYDFSVFESYAVFITVVGYIYSAFITTYVFRLPWELGGFVAIVGMGVNENLLDLTIYLRDSFAYSV
jgi:hypothetical protein